MNESPGRPPFFDWQLDVWKLIVLTTLFLLLLLWALLDMDGATTLWYVGTAA
jgi:hypothetical protein